MGVILVILALVNIFSIVKMSSLESQIDEISNSRLPRAISISDINTAIYQLRTSQLRQAITKNSTELKKQSNIMISVIDEINENIDIYLKLKKSSEKKGRYSTEEEQLFSEFDSSWEAYQDFCLDFFTLIQENDQNKAFELLNTEGYDSFERLNNNLDNLVRASQTSASQAALKAEISNRASRGVLSLLLIISIIISVIFSIFIIRYTSIPVRQLQKAAQSVAQGNLDVRLSSNSEDEIGNLAMSFNHMTSSLKAAMTKTEMQAKALQNKNRDLQVTLQELKATQDQLMIKGKMASLGRLVAGLAHEINNPLSSINSSIDVAKRCVIRLENARKVVDTTEKASSLILNADDVLALLNTNLSVITTATRRISELLKSLRNFARIDSTEFQRVDIHEGLDSTINLLGKDFENRIKVVKNYSDLPEIFCYPAQLNQAFLNVLQNASDAIDECGEISISTFIMDSNLIIEITDTGRGIPKEEIDRLFDFNFSNAGFRVKMGSGLATVYRIMEKHDGAIKIDSELNKGTTVTLTIPYEK